MSSSRVVAQWILGLNEPSWGIVVTRAASMNPVSSECKRKASDHAPALGVVENGRVRRSADIGRGQRPHKGIALNRLVPVDFQAGTEGQALATGGAALGVDVRPDISLVPLNHGDGLDGTNGRAGSAGGAQAVIEHDLDGLLGLHAHALS